MRRVLVVGVLAALIGVGFVSLPGPRMAGAEPPLPGSCGRQTDFPEACTFVLRSLDALADLQTRTLKALLKAARVRSGATCEQCVERMSDLQLTLATNGTSTDITEALSAQCERRFSGDRLDECLATVAKTPQIIDGTLAERPPLATCQEAGFCPAP